MGVGHAGDETVRGTLGTWVGMWTGERCGAQVSQTPAGTRCLCPGGGPVRLDTLLDRVAKDRGGNEERGEAGVRLESQEQPHVTPEIRASSVLREVYI